MLVVVCCLCLKYHISLSMHMHAWCVAYALNHISLNMHMHAWCVAYA